VPPTGVAAIFGPQTDVSADHVQSMCQTLRIPHIQMRWDPKRYATAAGTTTTNAPSGGISSSNIRGSGIVTTTSSVNNQQQNQRFKPSSNGPMSINLYPHPASLSRVYSFKFI